jgi:hypothetical protein
LTSFHIGGEWFRMSETVRHVIGVCRFKGRRIR